MKDNALYTEAFRLTVNGQSVIPLGPDKRPLILSWKQYQTEPASVEQIEAWWTQWPNANVGLVTGKVSGVTVVDIDAYKDGAPKITDFPPTYTIATGNGGVHLYYKYQEGLTISANAYPQYPHLDMRSDGGFVVAPPSITKYQKDGKDAGGVYRVINPLPLADFPMAQFPQRKPAKTLSQTIAVQEGGRNDNLTSFIGTLLLAHPERDWHTKVLPAVEHVNLTYKPPLPMDEVHATFNSIVSLERSRRAITAGEHNTDEENELRQGFIKLKTQGTYELAKYIVKKYDIITVGEKEQEMYVYQNGLYALAHNEIIAPEIQRILGPHVTKSAKLETTHKIADMTMARREIFATAPLHLIPLLNGVYDREARVLLPHSPMYRFTYQLPVSYDPAALCTKTSAFFDQVLDSDQRKIVEEWIGYYFYRNYMFKKAIIFVGEGDTGKTTMLEVIDFLLGKGNISSVSLQKMATDKFAAAHMYEKHGNLVDELSAKDISDTGNFKIATGGGSISGEYKFGNQFSFHNFSKLTFACNKIPDIKDFDDDAYFNRWMPIRFERTITKKIPNFIKTLTTDEERSGLFNLAMVGLDRLLEQGRFSYVKDAKETKRDMMRSGSSIAMFAAARLKQDLGAEIGKEQLYDAYTQFCVDNDLSVETMDMLGKKLLYYVPFAADGTTTLYGKKQRCWRNLGLVLTPEQVTASVAAHKEFENYGK